MAVVPGSVVSGGNYPGGNYPRWKLHVWGGAMGWQLSRGYSSGEQLSEKQLSTGNCPITMSVYTDYTLA